jgi:hypothetical protein
MVNRRWPSSRWADGPRGTAVAPCGEPERRKKALGRLRTVRAYGAIRSARRRTVGAAVPAVVGERLTRQGNRKIIITGPIG